MFSEFIIKLMGYSETKFFCGEKGCGGGFFPLFSTHWTKHVLPCMAGTSKATARFQESDFFQRPIAIVSRCILSVIIRHSGFKL